MNKILILGGTGAMGEHLVSLLENRDWKVYVTSRAKHSCRNNIFYIQGNAHNDAFLKSLFQDSFDVVVDFMVYSTSEFSQRVSWLLDNCSQYVYISSARVYSNEDEIITENTPRLLDVCKDERYLATDEYALTKARQENILMNSSKNNWTIIRPYITYSEIRLQLGVLEKEAWLRRAIDHQTIVFSEDIASKTTTLTYGQDVSKAILSIIGKQEAWGEAFHITTDEHLMWRNILDIYMNTMEETLNFRPKVLMITESQNLRYEDFMWQVKYDRHFNRRFDNSKIKRFIDTTTFITPDVGLDSCLKTFLKTPRFRNINIQREALLDRWTNEITPHKYFNGIKGTLKYHIYRWLTSEDKL